MISKSEQKRLHALADVINCQGDHSGEGCSTCGGYGYVLVKIRLTCGHEYWNRPGVHTSYIGKTFTSMDGLDIVVTDKGYVCKACALDSTLQT